MNDSGREPLRIGVLGAARITELSLVGPARTTGHPIGGPGRRILVTLLHEMRRRDAKKGVAALCIGGGMGVSLAVERA